MRDGMWAHDGARMQGWKRRAFSNRFPARPGASSTLKIGLVTRVIHKDDPDNLSGSYAEYNVLLMDSLMELPNVSVMGLKNSQTSGDEFTLKACSEVPDAQNPEDVSANFFSSDGDIVIVAFLHRNFPLIIGTLNHQISGEDAAPWHGETADGERRAIHHKDTSVIIDKSSNVEISLPDDKELIINIDGSQVFRVYNGGGAKVVELGAGAEKVVLGQTFQTWWDTNIKNHTHTAGTLLDSLAAPCSGSTGQMGGGLGIAFPNGNLSDVTRTD